MKPSQKRSRRGRIQKQLPSAAESATGASDRIVQPYDWLPDGDVQPNPALTDSSEDVAALRRENELLRGQLQEMQHLINSGQISFPAEPPSDGTSHQSLERERLIMAISQKIFQCAGLDEVLNTTATEARQLLNTDRVVIYSFQQVIPVNPNLDWYKQVNLLFCQGATVVEAVDSNYPSMLGYSASRFLLPESSLQRYSIGTAIAISDINHAEMSSAALELMHYFTVKSLLVVPILHEARLWGVLTAHHCSAVRQWQFLDIQLLLQLVTPVGIAIHQNALLARIEVQTQRERTLNSLVLSIRSSLNLHTIFTTAVHELGQLLPVDAVQVMQYSLQGKVWTVVAEHRKYGFRFPHKKRRLRDSEGHLYNQLKNSSSVRLYEENSFQQLTALSEPEVTPGAGLLVPLMVDQELWGSLNLLVDLSTYRWQTEETALVEAVANQIAIAIEQSLLYHRVRQLNSNLEIQVRERTTQLERSLRFEALLRRITTQIRDSLDESEILQAVAQELATGLSVLGCDVALYDYDEERAIVCSEAWNGAVPIALKKEMPWSEHSPIFDQLVNGNPFQFSTNDPTLEWATILACPIVVGSGSIDPLQPSVVGDLWLFKNRRDAFSEQEICIVQHAADQCAIALRQSRLFQTAQAQVSELEKLNRLKDDFLSTVSHELRTPLSTIKMSIQMMEILLQQKASSEGTALPETAVNQPIQPLMLQQPHKLMQCLSILKEECDREINLINDLLSLQQIDAGTQPVLPLVIRLQNWLPEVVETFEEQAAACQQTLSVEVDDNLPPLVSDLFMFNRIVGELLTNACKFTPRGGSILVSARQVATSERIVLPHPFKRQSVAHSAYIQIRIRNTGIEIPENELLQIFDKFYRIPRTDPWQHSGTGLGLALVKKLCAYLGGAVWAESEPGQTTFMVELPINRDERLRGDRRRN